MGMLRGGKVVTGAKLGAFFSHKTYVSVEAEPPNPRKLQANPLCAYTLVHTLPCIRNIHPHLHVFNLNPARALSKVQHLRLTLHHHVSVVLQPSESQTIH